MGTPYVRNDRSEQGEEPETGVAGSVGTSSRLRFANADLVANSESDLSDAARRKLAGLDANCWRWV